MVVVVKGLVMGLAKVKVWVLVLRLAWVLGLVWVLVLLSVGVSARG